MRYTGRAEIVLLSRRTILVWVEALFALGIRTFHQGTSDLEVGRYQWVGW